MGHDLADHPGPPRVNAGELRFEQTGRPNAVPGAVVAGTPTRPAMPILLTRYVTWMACVPSLRTEAPGQEGERSSPDPGDSPADGTTCAALIPRGFCNRTVASARPPPGRRPRRCRGAALPTGGTPLAAGPTWSSGLLHPAAPPSSTPHWSGPATPASLSTTSAATSPRPPTSP